MQTIRPANAASARRRGRIGIATPSCVLIDVVVRKVVKHEVVLTSKAVSFLPTRGMRPASSRIERHEKPSITHVYKTFLF